MDLSTDYLGLHLEHPLIPGAGPLSEDLDLVRRLEDAGAPAIVMSSLFEEQFVREQTATWRQTDRVGHITGEATSFFPEHGIPALGPEAYLERIARLKAAVRVPVIASLNGTTDGGWLECARRIEQAGADALELNVYALPDDPRQDAAAIEARTLSMVATLRGALTIPLAVKLSPFYTALADVARRLDEAGADGLVLFNRVYQPEFDLEELEVRPALQLSNPSELPLRLRWIGLLSGRVRASLAVTGGVHGVLDVVRAVAAGAHAVQVVSALLMHGPEHLARLRMELAHWLEEHEYASLAQARGSLSAANCPDPEAYGRANYMLSLKSWRLPPGWR
ncbi:MAG TPA: dihydroorotate dehydrogenase-like protein [Planctomycetota bacterium]|nr:dihydroorotate dehydrogenase-like protein [Planctomycetota bacterium]